LKDVDRKQEPHRKKERIKQSNKQTNKQTTADIEKGKHFRSSNLMQAQVESHHINKEKDFNPK
jgi:hypothetical protein